MFQKLVAIEPLHLAENAQEELTKRAQEFYFYEDIPETEEEVIQRIQDADGILVSLTTEITANIIEQCPNLRYIGMCCSLYDESSASVDIRCARAHGITVTGVNDYGDIGVGEYVVSELISLLHGFHGSRWGDVPLELTEFPVGIIGMGATGQVIANALHLLGAKVTYYSRTRKEDVEARGISYLPLAELLTKNICICTCVNKFVTILEEAQFHQLGNHRILFNTGLTPASDLNALKKWLSHGDNYYYCDSQMALGDSSLLSYKHVHYFGAFSGSSYQTTQRLTEKTIQNIDRFFS